MSTLYPAQYWRQNKTWAEWLGCQGKVVGATVVEVTSPELQVFAPYSLVIVDFGKTKKTLMGAGHQTFEVGDTVKCVLRRQADSAAAELIPYTLKVTKVTIV